MDTQSGSNCHQHSQTEKSQWTPVKLQLLGSSRNEIYLEKVSKELGENEDNSVDLLIGADCLEALKPVEVIPRQNDGSYAIWTALGRWVVGPIKVESHNAVLCNQIAVIKVDSRKMAKHHFEI